MPDGRLRLEVMLPCGDYGRAQLRELQIQGLLLRPVLYPDGDYHWNEPLVYKSLDYFYLLKFLCLSYYQLNAFD